MELVKNILKYLELRLEYTRYSLQKMGTHAIAVMVTLFVLAAPFFLFVMLMSLGAGWLVGESLGSPAIGFFCVGAFYLFVTLIIFLLRKKLIAAFSNFVFLRLEKEAHKNDELNLTENAKPDQQYRPEDEPGKELGGSV